MYKFTLKMGLLLGSLAGVSSATQGVEPARSSHATASTAYREQDFGPYTFKVADAKAAAWGRKGYVCRVYQGFRGWYVRVRFPD